MRLFYRYIVPLAVLALILGGCGDPAPPGLWESDDFRFCSPASVIVIVPRNSQFLVSEDCTALISYEDAAAYREYAGLFASDRGVGIGTAYRDYLSSYGVAPGYAAWELYEGDDTGEVTMASYDRQLPRQMYGEGYTRAWLDIGYRYTDGAWMPLTDHEIQDVYFCDAPLDRYGDCVIFSAGFDESGTVRGLSLEYFDYGEIWRDFQEHTFLLT